MSINLLKEILTSKEVNISKRTLENVFNSTTLKIFGDVNEEIFFFTKNSFSQKILERNLSSIKKAYKNITGKYPFHIFINNVKMDVEIKELNEIETINRIEHSNIDSIRKEDVGLNEKFGSIFYYDTSILNKKKIIIKMHNKFLGKYWEEEINTRILTNKIFYFQKKKLINHLKSFLKIKYESYSTDTEELLKFLNII